ncbi:hypothetical protein GCM10023142_32960 [Anaerocolumna aminovalerica]|jgi:hypothetical protein|uniref:Uncharacterized protein n=1 Tax=Anaerocolumna aminovalerica TaxID=1527 RepID=A0A1I5EA97_9FIRM|nr:DUF6033 family protein [Anaerocolumna aminovalerica]MDU6263298.1 DUF6033 family protein [Anaerocolumna aminovalerica]SFO08442.1 hypothetical protein SAMN04489757_108123 [Anaerocolumna aminovalerica]
MSTISQTDGSIAKTSYTSTETAQKPSKADYGNIIGSPELSEKAQKYYEQLKKKYSHMDFILVSMDKKEEAKANAGKYAKTNRIVVLIDTEKIEKMASDESYRKQYEGIISGAAAQLSQLKSSLGSNADSVKTYGMQVNDNGTASFFAVVDKSLAAQKKRIEKNAAKKAEEKKQSEKAAKEKRAEKKRAEDSSKADTDNKAEDIITVTASSIEELIQKINNVLYAGMSDNVQTEKEKQIGQNIDFKG